jgi:hypothetical protein
MLAGSRRAGKPILGPAKPRSAAMTVCPIAIAVGCQRCPAFKVCPLKAVLGDQPKSDAAEAPKPASPAKRGGAKKP